MHTKPPKVDIQPHISCLKQSSLLFISKASWISQHPFVNSEEIKAQREKVPHISRSWGEWEADSELEPRYLPVVPIAG